MEVARLRASGHVLRKPAEPDNRPEILVGGSGVLHEGGAFPEGGGGQHQQRHRQRAPADDVRRAGRQGARQADDPPRHKDRHLVYRAADGGACGLRAVRRGHTAHRQVAAVRPVPADFLHHLYVLSEKLDGK